MSYLDEGGLAWVEFSSLGVCSRAGDSRLQLRLFNWLAHRSISPCGSRAYAATLWLPCRCPFVFVGVHLAMPLIAGEAPYLPVEKALNAWAPLGSDG